MRAIIKLKHISILSYQCFVMESFVHHPYLKEGNIPELSRTVTQHFLSFPGPSRTFQDPLKVRKQLEDFQELPRRCVNPVTRCPTHQQTLNLRTQISLNDELRTTCTNKSLTTDHNVNLKVQNH